MQVGIKIKPILCLKISITDKERINETFGARNLLEQFTLYMFILRVFLLLNTLPSEHIVSSDLVKINPPPPPHQDGGCIFKLVRFGGC